MGTLTGLSWEPIDLATVVLGAPELLYEDSLPMSDILITPSGSTCALRRVPHKAEVIVWDGLPSGPPVSWTGEPRLPLLGIFGFDGDEVFGWNESSIIRIRPGTVETLVEVKEEIRHVALSPDRKRLLWIEQGRQRRLRTCSTNAPRPPALLRAEGSCGDAVWLSDGRIAATQIHQSGDTETGASVVIHEEGASRPETLLHTSQWMILNLHPAPSGAGLFVSAGRWGYESEKFSSSPREIGTWLVSLGRDAVACVANASPARGTFHAVGSTCVFADALQQRGDSSVLVAANRSSATTGKVAAFLGDLDVHESTLVYRTLAEQFTLHSLSIGPLLQ